MATSSEQADDVVCIVRVWLPDLPGTLGRVATRVGAAGGDVVGIDILERGGGRAVDELTVVLPAAGLVDALVAELGGVAGVAVEDVRVVPSLPPDSGTLGLGVAARLAEATPELRRDLLCAEVLEAFGGDWIALVVEPAGEPVSSLGLCPDPVWLAAFLAGIRHLGPQEQVGSAPGDLAWAAVGASATVVIGRRSTPFHARERIQLGLLGRIAGALQLQSVAV